MTLSPLAPDLRYTLVFEAGLRQAEIQDAALTGAEWQTLQAALDDHTPFTATLRRIATLNVGSNAALRGQLRVLLNYHCGVATLRTRQMMRDLQAL